MIATEKGDEVNLYLGRHCRIHTDADILRAVAQAAGSMATSSGPPRSCSTRMNKPPPPAPDRLIDATATAAAAAAAVTTPVGAPP
eukprot:COSAG03_NODE_1797_length_3507_cov_380.294014_1_plen_85_part_00